MVLIAIGYRTPQQTPGSVSNVSLPATIEASTPAVNEVVATTIAANVAATTNLSVASAVSSLAISTQIESELPASDDSTISKPQIIELSAASRNITTYKVKRGETVSDVARRFGISNNTVKWANNLTSGELTAGQNLQILPRNGIVYTVRGGDRIEDLAKKYRGNVATITAYNDLEISGIKPGLKIIIPNGVLPVNERPGYAAPTTTFIAGYGVGFAGDTWHIRVGTPMYGGNNYGYGYCTAYVYDRRVQLGKPIKPSWGNAVSWAYNARAAGYRVDNKPSVGAVIQNGGGAGHVAIVEDILANGDLSLSEMNASVPGGGWNVVSGRILPAAYVGQYLYIH